jgi:hypothetical protein
MTTLRIITDLIVSFGHVTLMTFAIVAFLTLRRMERRQEDMHCNITNAMMLLMGQHLKSELDQLGDMKRDLNRLVETEQYEAANQLKALIERQQKIVSQTMENMRENFGDRFKVENTVIPVHPDNDNES